jgi:hypothetical protein
MNTSACRRVSLVHLALVFASLLTLGDIVSAQTRVHTLPLPIADVKSGTGEKIAQRIDSLRESNESVRAALAAFEKKGLKLNVMKSVAISGTISHDKPSFRSAKYQPQQRAISGNGVEVLLVSFLSLFNEWQGSTITTFTNPDGSIAEQYIADIVLTRSEFDPTDWTCRFEVKFEDGVGILEHEPGMFTGFHLGTPIQQQESVFGTRPPLDLLESQFTSPEAREAYYQRFPQQRLYDDMAHPSGGGGEKLPMEPANYIIPQRDPNLPWRPPSNGGNTVRGWRRAGREAGMVCGAGAGGCAIASAIFAEATWAPCFVSTCAGGILYAAVANLRVGP